MFLSFIIYGFPALTTIKGYCLAKICAGQNILLRQISNLPFSTTNKKIHEYLSVPSIPKRIQELLNNGLEPLDIHPNPLLVNAIMYDLIPIREVPKVRHFLLYNFDY